MKKAENGVAKSLSFTSKNEVSQNNPFSNDMMEFWFGTHVVRMSISEITMAFAASLQNEVKETKTEFQSKKKSRK